MLKGRQSSTPAGREEPDDLHMQLISSGTGAFTGRCDSRNDLRKRRRNFYDASLRSTSTSLLRESPVTDFKSQPVLIALQAELSRFHL